MKTLLVAAIVALCLIAVQAQSSSYYIPCTTSGQEQDFTLTDSTNSLGCSSYSASVNYHWQISSSHTNYKFLLHFNSFNTEYHYDYVKIYDGTTTSDPVLGAFSGNSVPDDVVSTGPNVLVVFTSDSSINASGFKITYEVVDAGSNVAPCTGDSPHSVTLTEDSDTFGCDGYSNNANWTWYIDADGADHVVLTFESFTTEHNYDYVKVYEGNTVATSALIGSYSGSTLPEPITSNSNQLTVTFTSDYSVTGSGFTASYESLFADLDPCFNDTQISLVSHEGYFGCPYGYGNGVDSSWLIQTTEGHVIELDFLSFSTESGYDYLKVYNGATTSTQLIGTYSGTTPPPTITSSTNQVLVTFHTDSSVTANGFTATYMTFQQAGPCSTNSSQQLTDPTGSFGCNGSYGSFVYDSWLIEAQPNQDGQIVNLEFQTFDIADDTVYVYDGESSSATLLGEYTGSTIPDPIMSSQTYLYVLFVTNGSNKGTGFTAVYTSMDNPDSESDFDCSHSTTYQISGELQGDFGCDGYSNSVSVTWDISVAVGMSIELSFQSFDTEHNYDWVTIYDGPLTTNTTLGRYSGTTIPPPVQSSGHVVTVVFTSDSSVSRTGFSAEYTAVSAPPVQADCSTSRTQNLNTNDGTFGCDGYSNSVTMTWYITVESGYIIQLDFTNFYTENNYDWVSVYDGSSSSSTRIGHFSGNSIPPELTTSGNQMTVIFTSDYSVTKTGFNAVYTSIGQQNQCTTDQSYTLTSPTGDFGCDGYGNSVDSSWLISVSSGSRITLSFLSLDTETYYDYVRVYDGADSSATRIGTYSGTTVPAPYTSSTNQLYVTFHSDSSVSSSYSGFTAEYVSVRSYSSPCTSSTSYSLTDPNASFGCGGYGNSVTVSWSISSYGPIHLSFSSFSTEHNYDWVNVYDGTSTSATRIGHFSGTSIPSPLTSTGNNLFVQLVTDYSVTGSGFTADYVTVVLN